MEMLKIEGVELQLSNPIQMETRWVGQEEVLKQVLASWYLINDKDVPLNPRLIGKPGVGKTTLAYSAAKILGLDVYMFQATVDTRPEDLIITPVVSGVSQIKYVASSLLTAVIKGGVIILDEGNRMSEKSWASLAPLLDHRRYVESIIAGIRINAHKNFRFITTMNDDASTFDLPEYIHSRLTPQVYIDFPDRDEEMEILREHLPDSQKEILEYVVNFLQRAHAMDEPYTVRDGINIARYALKSMKYNNMEINEALRTSVKMILKDDAQRILE